MPSALSRIYTVRIDYRGGERPDITILQPQLETHPEEVLPHVYPGERLCLFFPGEWTGGQLLVKTIVPWTSELLLHYEIWKATRQWTGGGHEQSSRTLATEQRTRSIRRR